MCALVVRAGAVVTRRCLLLTLHGGAQLQESLAAHHEELSDLTTGWREKRKRTRELWRRRRQLLGRLGLFVATGSHVGINSDSHGGATSTATSSVGGSDVGDITLPLETEMEMQRTTAHLVNLSEDPMMSEALTYPLRTGTTTIGSDASQVPLIHPPPPPPPCSLMHTVLPACDPRAFGCVWQDITVSGLNILPQHCSIANTVTSASRGAFELVLTAFPGAQVFVNGLPVRQLAAAATTTAAAADSKRDAGDTTATPHAQPGTEDADILADTSASLSLVGGAEVVISDGDRVVLGHAHMFLLRDPRGSSVADAHSVTTAGVDAEAGEVDGGGHRLALLAADGTDAVREYVCCGVGVLCYVLCVCVCVSRRRRCCSCCCLHAIWRHGGER